MLGGIIEIASDQRSLAVHRGLLQIRDNDQVLGHYPIDDITAVILTGHQQRLSKNVMIRLAEVGAVIVVCGRNFHPISMLLPTHGHHRQQQRIAWQIKLSIPLKKRLWQKIIQQKIQHQAEVLSWQSNKQAITEKLQALAGRVKSGDPDNQEAYAAQLYWKAMFGADFRRQREEAGINAMLNYGYAIMRAAIARSIAAAGLISALGIYHQNQRNPFCLVDDLMEPYRPLVDDLVLQLYQSDGDKFTPQLKRQLASLLTHDLKNKDGEVSPVFQTMHQLVHSLVLSYQHKKMALIYPNIQRVML